MTTEQTSLKDAAKNATDTELTEILLDVLEYRTVARRAITAHLVAQAEKEKPPRLRVEKAQGQLVPVVRWLLARSRQEKLTAVVAEIFGAGGDRENELKRNMLYDGELGEDLRRDWQDEAAQWLESGEDFEERHIVAFALGALAVT